MAFRRNRYDGVALLSQLDGQAPEPDGDLWRLRFECDEQFEDITEFYAYVPDEEPLRLAAIKLLREFLPRLGQLDNLVQASCEREWRASEFDASSYELHIAHLTPTVEDETVSVEYYGTIVNTNWAAVFKRDGTNDEWSPVNFEP
jgi:hypothetical protein